MNGKVSPAPIPAGSLHQHYDVEGGYVDCFVAEVPRAVSLQQLIVAFYTSPVFRPERWLLGTLLGKRADDRDAARLAVGETTQFSAWTVEAREGDQILLCDFQQRTRSWLRVVPITGGTQLYFGSALVPAKSTADRLAVSALTGFHRWYSRILLRGAVRRLG